MRDVTAESPLPGLRLPLTSPAGATAPHVARVLEAIIPSEERAAHPRVAPRLVLTPA